MNMLLCSLGVAHDSVDLVHELRAGPDLRVIAVFLKRRYIIAVSVGLGNDDS